MHIRINYSKINDTKPPVKPINNRRFEPYKKPSDPSHQGPSRARNQNSQSCIRIRKHTHTRAVFVRAERSRAHQTVWNWPSVNPGVQPAHEGLFSIFTTLSRKKARHFVPRRGSRFWRCFYWFFTQLRLLNRVFKTDFRGRVRDFMFEFALCLM